MAQTKPKKAKAEFAPKRGSKPGAVAKALKADAKQDKAVAKRYGVRFTGHK